MIDNLLAMSSVERDQHAYKIQQIDLVPLLRNIVSELEPSLSSNGIAIQIRLPHEEFEVSGDREAIRRVFINLIDNAAKYASEGKAIEIILDNSSSKPTATVRDLGPGIPKDKSETIFQAFAQLNDTLTDKAPGIGLGLSLSRSIMRKLGGELRLDTSYKKGASFIITFDS